MARVGATPKTERAVAMDQKDKSFTYNQKLVLRRRALDPKDYIFVKETYSALYVRNVHTGIVKIINKCN
jgi:hypothetical protein